MGGLWLTILIFVPVLGAVVVALMPKSAVGAIRGVATATLAVPLALLIGMFIAFHYNRSGLQFVERVAWIPAWHVQYFLGVDGLSMAMLALTAVVGLIAAIASYGIEHRVKEYYVWYLLMQTAILGVFCAENLILFLFFFDIVLLPMYFLIAIWGGPRRQYAAMKFLIYTFIGSTVMLVAVLALFFLTGGRTFSIPALTALAGGHIGATTGIFIFLGIFFGFAIKLPVVPFHTWLPDAHVEAPTAISVVLAGVLLKIGGYGMLRIAMPLVPRAAHVMAPVLAVMAIINIIYGALAAMSQHDFKKMVAYSSVSHMGYVLLGVAAMTPLAVDGAIFQMVSHGLISALLFLMVGVFYDRTHTREFSRLGGMYRSLPLAGTVLAFGALANLGLPTLSGFVAEFFTLAGSFTVFRTLVFWAALGIVLTAGFNLIMMQRVLKGPPRPEWSQLPAVKTRELVTLVPLMVGCLVLGLLPATLLHVINVPALHLVHIFHLTG